MELRVFFGQATDFPLGGPKRQSYGVGPTWASIHGPHMSFLWVVHTGFAKTHFGAPKGKTAVGPVWVHAIRAQMQMCRKQGCFECLGHLTVRFVFCFF